MEGVEQSFTQKNNNTTIESSYDNKDNSTEVKKNKPIIEDINANRFINTIVTSKRSKLQCQLKEEIFDTTGNRVHKIVP